MGLAQCFDPTAHTAFAGFATHLTGVGTKLFIVVDDVVVFISAVVDVETQSSILFFDLSCNRGWLCYTHQLTAQVVDQLIPTIATLKTPVFQGLFAVVLQIPWLKDFREGLSNLFIKLRIHFNYSFQNLLLIFIF